MANIINKTLTIKGVEYKITYKTSDFLQTFFDGTEVFDELWITIGTGEHPRYFLRFPFSMFYMRPSGRMSVTESRKFIKKAIKENIPCKKARKVISREVLKAYSRYLKLLFK